MDLLSAVEQTPAMYCVSLRPFHGLSVSRRFLYVPHLCFGERVRGLCVCCAFSMSNSGDKLKIRVRRGVGVGTNYHVRFTIVSSKLERVPSITK